jgi:hypothetical protein
LVRTRGFAITVGIAPHRVAIIRIHIRTELGAVLSIHGLGGALGVLVLNRIAVAKQVAAFEIDLTVFDGNPRLFTLAIPFLLVRRKAALVARFHRLERPLVARSSLRFVGAPVPASLIHTLRHRFSTPTASGATTVDAV